MLSELLAGSHRRRLIYGLGIGVLLYVVLLVSLALTRKPWNDEAMAALAGYNLGFHGHTGVNFYDEQASGFTRVSSHTYYMFPFQFCVLAVWYHLVPFGLLTTRLLAMLWSFVMLGSIYIVVKRITLDPMIGLSATLLTALDYHILEMASFGRYDTMVAALGFGGYAFYLVLRETNLYWAILGSHAMIVAAGATHPNGMFYCAGLWALMLYFDRSRITWRHLAVAVIPYCAGGILYAAYILRDLPAFRAQFGRNSGGRIGILRPWETLLAEIRVRYITAFGLGGHLAGHNSPLVKLKAFNLLVYLAGVLGCLIIPSIRQNRRFHPLFLLTAVHWFLMTFYENMKFSYYLVHLVPFYWALVAIVAVTLWRKRQISPFAIAAPLVAACLISLGGALMKIRLNDYGNVYAPAVAYLNQNARPQDQVFGSCGLGFGIGFTPRFRDDETFGYVSGVRPAYLVVEEIYDGQHNLYKQQSPPLYAHIQRVLASYDLVFHNSEYRIYRRPGSVTSSEMVRPGLSSQAN